MLPPECSDLARAAYDVLMGGYQAFELGANPSREEVDNWLDDRRKLLAAFLGSPEPIPDVMRLALADAIERRGDPPVYLRLEMGRKSPQRALRIMEESRRAKEGLRVYEEALEAGSGHAHATELGAEAAGMGLKRFAAYKANLNAGRLRDAEISAAFHDDNVSIHEIYELMSSPVERKRGRQPKR